MTIIRRFIISHWPFFAALTVLWGVTAGLLGVSLQKNKGKFIYALDDPYIHLAVAKNLAEGKGWNITGEGFEPATSSLSWPILLAALHRLFGVREIYPLVLNLFLSSFILLTIYRFLIRDGFSVSSRLVFGVLILMIIALPLPLLVMMGMEQIFQTLLVLLVVGGILWPPSCIRMGFLALLAASTRYEMVVVVGVAILFFLAKRRWRLSGSMILGFIFPIILYGIASISHGGFWLPNPLVVKTPFSYITSFHDLVIVMRNIVLYHLGGSIDTILIVILMMVLGVVLWMSRKKIKIPSRVFLLLFVFFVLAWSHLFFFSASQFFRYDAAIIALGVWLVGTLVCFSLLQRVIINTIFFFLIIMFIVRGGVGLVATPAATHEIFLQQYQMAQFLKQYYPNTAVALNDIGAVGFFTNVKIIDLWGLGSLDVARAKTEKRYSSETIDIITRSHGVKIAIVYDRWFDKYGSLPKSWFLVARQRILLRSTWVLGGDTISFYALDSQERDVLQRNLKEFIAEEYYPEVETQFE